MIVARNILYPIGLIISALLSGVLFWKMGKRRGLSSACLWQSQMFGSVLGIIGSKLFYLSVRGTYLLPTYGWQAMVRLRWNEFAMSGAVIGVLGGLFVAARISGNGFRPLLNAFAPAGLLLIALSRFFEYFVDFGLGRYVENSMWKFFPYAVVNEYGEWFQAIFMMEGFVALIAFVVVFKLSAFPFWPGGKLALVLWALPQIFFESFRNESLRWGFVRIQQVACAAFVLLVMIDSATRLRKQNEQFAQTFWSFGLFFSGVAMCVFVEFALDKMNIPILLSYGMMLAAIGLMGIAAVMQMKKIAVHEKSDSKYMGWEGRLQK